MLFSRQLAIIYFDQHFLPRSSKKRQRQGFATLLQVAVSEEGVSSFLNPDGDLTTLNGCCYCDNILAT